MGYIIISRRREGVTSGASANVFSNQIQINQRLLRGSVSDVEKLTRIPYRETAQALRVLSKGNSFEFFHPSGFVSLEIALRSLSLALISRSIVSSVLHYLSLMQTSFLSCISVPYRLLEEDVVFGGELFVVA